ncbi:Hypothetical Protein FCC1311_035362 [Hondaea fermentalgiana]|uniref:Uncharacterized protein n=1 Tax=Hondaea fermentalgiana TaxID=2315210 RepID=A0A2R5GHG2_9STRA|nr:Hypothetical Protein FCC1311_035362 [Hondaea fermentalgiana]|eukprot:GBG27314.1 Hypothetical Protein FCC1311_035362 [Hondaea fermentalgiana]
MGCTQSNLNLGELGLVAQVPPLKAAWESLVVTEEGWSFKVQPSALTAENSAIKNGKGEDVALVKTIENKHKGTTMWTLLDLEKQPQFKITAGSTSGTFFLSGNGVVATIQKKYQNSDSEIEVYIDDHVGDDDFLLFTCLGKTHNLYVVNSDGETVARARKGTRFIDVAKGVDAIYIIGLYLVREQLDHISETFN